MPQLPVPDMSTEQFVPISKFLVQYIKDQNLGADDCIPGQTLIQLCRMQFYDESQDGENVPIEKRIVKGAIIRMVKDKVLQAARLNDTMTFRLHPTFNVEDQMKGKEPERNEDDTEDDDSRLAIESLEKEVTPDEQIEGTEAMRKRMPITPANAPANL